MKQNFKKIICLLLAVLFTAACFAGCKNNSESGAPAESEAKEDKVVNVGFIQLIDMNDATIMNEAFKKELSDKGYDEKIVVTYKDAAGDQGAMSTAIQGFISNGVDLIIPQLTPPAMAVANATADTDIPMIFMSVTEPVASGIIEDFDKPGTKATGTSNKIPADLTLSAAMEITPLKDNQKAIIMYNTSQDNAKVTKEAAVKYCEENSIPYEVKSYEDANTALQVAQSLNKETAGFVYVCLDSVIANSFNQVADALVKAGIPSYNPADAMVQTGGFCSYSVDYSKIGKMTADMVIDWYNGKKIEDMPVQILDEFNFVVNKTTMEALNITLPEKYESSANYVETAAAE